MKILINKFIASVEIKEYISYVKLVDKRETPSIDKLYDQIYQKINGEGKITKEELKSMVYQFSNGFLLTNLLKEIKLSTFYDVYTDEFVSEETVTKEPVDSVCTIMIEKDYDKPYDKDLINNYLSDNFNDEYFILDIRSYDSAKKYYNAEFALYLTQDGFELESERDSFVEFFLNQYDYRQILDMICVNNNYNFKGNFLYLNDTYEEVKDILFLDPKKVEKQLNQCFEDNYFLFINQNLLKNLDISIDHLLEHTNENKLIILLEKEDYDSYNYNRLPRGCNLEIRDNLHILRINEGLFREACGYNTHILFMGKDYHLALSKVSEQLDEFTFLSKVKVDGVKYLSSIIFTYQEVNRDQSYINDLKVLSFVLSSQDLQKYLNFYIVNNVKLGYDNKVNYYLNNKRSKISLNACESFLDFALFINRMDKQFVFSPEAIEILIPEVKDAIIKIDDLKLLEHYKEVLNRIIEVCNLEALVAKEKSDEIFQIIDFKIKLKKEHKEIKYIINTDIFVENPEVLNNYFFNKEVVIPKRVVRELENVGSMDINATRARRSIVMAKDYGHNVKIIDDIESSVVSNEDLSFNDKQLLAIAMEMHKEDILPIVVSNSVISNLKFKQKQIEVISSDLLKIIV